MKEHRKRIWIDSFQTGLLVRIVVYLVLYQAIMWGFLAGCDLLNAKFVRMGVDVSSLRNPLVRTVLSLLVLGPALVLDAVRFAHRVVGPLYRIRKTIQAVTSGERVALVQLREGDLLQDLKEDLNAMLLHLEQQGCVLLKAPRTAVNGKARQTVGADTHPGFSVAGATHETKHI